MILASIIVMFARLCFCIVPALVAGLVTSMVHPAVGLMFGCCVFALGMDVTRCRPERGERP